MSFHEILNELILDSKKLIAEIAKDLNLSLQTLYDYLSGKTLPKLKNLILLADYLNCTIDYLVGREEENYSKTFIKCEPFNIRLSCLFDKYGLTDYKVNKATGISTSLLFEWRKGFKEPLFDNLIKLSDYFDCTIDYLVGRES